MKNLILIIFLSIGAIATMKVEDGCNKKKFDKLRTEDLTIHTEGIITKVSNHYRDGMIVYAYSFKIGERKYLDTFKMKKVYEGIKPGSSIGVVYLKSDPEISRLIFTDEDFDWR